MHLDSQRAKHTATRDLPANRSKRLARRKPNRYMRRMMFRVKVTMQCPRCNLPYLGASDGRCQCKVGGS